MRLRAAVEAMPRHAREAMLRGIEANTIIVGAYTDPASGGVCPMLAAHRNGGRIDLASFARSWDRYTDADEPRPATRRELRTLVALLESSLTDDVPLDGIDAPRRSLPAPVTPPERPGLAYRIRRLPRRHLSRVAVRAR
jgi:hypothetical protein